MLFRSDGDGEKADVADVILRMTDGVADWQPKSVGEIIDENPHLQNLINNLDLQIDKNGKEI